MNDEQEAIDGAYLFRIMESRRIGLPEIFEYLKTTNYTFDLASFLEAVKTSGRYSKNQAEQMVASGIDYFIASGQFQDPSSLANFISICQLTVDTVFGELQ